MKHLAICLLVHLVCAAVASAVAQGNKAESRAGDVFTRCYSEYGQTGFYYDFVDYVPDLGEYFFDNRIRSVCQTGLWFYYENVEYNQAAGSVYWIHGIEFCADLPRAYSDESSSLRYGGSPYSLNENSFTLYQGEYFTGSEYWGNTDHSELSYLDDDASSLVLTGKQPWTLYASKNYGGYAVCVWPNTDHDVGPNGEELDLGIFSSISEIGFADNSVSSVAKGCWSKNVVHAPKPESVLKAKNGAMGKFNIPKKNVIH